MQHEVLAESEAMILDTKGRFQRALEDLEEFVVSLLVVLLLLEIDGN